LTQKAGVRVSGVRGRILVRGQGQGQGWNIGQGARIWE